MTEVSRIAGSTSSGATCCFDDDALGEAVRYTDVDAVRAALQRGYSPNRIGIYQWTPLHEAASSGDYSILELLLEKGGDPNVHDSLKGRTPLHYAAENDHARCVQILLSAGSASLASDKDGCSALDVAKGRSKMLIQKYLPEEMTAVATESVSPRNGLPSESSMTETSVSIEPSREISPTGSVSLLLQKNIWQGVSARESDSVSEPSSRALSVDATAFGYLTLSVEYNSKRSTLKIRPWQLTDLLIPPREHSSLSSVYIKSYLLPDRPRATKRKSEEVKVYSAEKAQSREEKGLYQAAAFQFAKALEYSGVTREMVLECTLWLEVCFTQRLTRRSFTCASMCLPLREAVRKLMRERVALHACPGLPADMRPFSTHDSNALFLYNERLFYSQPELRGRTGQVSVESDQELHGILVHQLDRPLSVSISLPEEDDQHDSLPVLVHQSPRDDSSVISMGSSLDSDDSDPLQQVDVDSQDSLHSRSTHVHLDENGESIV